MLQNEGEVHFIALSFEYVIKVTSALTLLGIDYSVQYTFMQRWCIYVHKKDWLDRLGTTQTPEELNKMPKGTLDDHGN